MGNEVNGTVRVKSSKIEVFTQCWGWLASNGGGDLDSGSDNKRVKEEAAILYKKPRSYGSA